MSKSTKRGGIRENTKRGKRYGKKSIEMDCMKIWLPEGANSTQSEEQPRGGREKNDVWGKRGWKETKKAQKMGHESKKDGCARRYRRDGTNKGKGSTRSFHPEGSIGDETYKKSC